eukprot:2193561-Rhodomonas_salina.1
MLTRTICTVVLLPVSLVSLRLGLWFVFLISLLSCERQKPDSEFEIQARTRLSSLLRLALDSSFRVCCSGSGSQAGCPRLLSLRLRLFQQWLGKLS